MLTKNVCHIHLTAGVGLEFFLKYQEFMKHQVAKSTTVPYEERYHLCSLQFIHSISLRACASLLHVQHELFLYLIISSYQQEIFGSLSSICTPPPSNHLH
jgi:hypothetical protein